MENKKQSKNIFLLLWLAVCLTLFAQILINPPSFKSEIFELLTKSTEDSTDLATVSKVLKENSGSLVFYVESSNYKDLMTLANVLRQEVEAAGHLHINFIDSNQKLNEYLKQLGPEIYTILDYETQRSLSEELDATKLKSNILRKLSSPLSAFYSEFLQYDPLMLSADFFIQQKSGIPGEVSDLGVMTQHGARYGLTMFANFQSSQLSFEDQKKSIALLDRLISNVNDREKLGVIQWTGFSKFSIESRSQIEAEIKMFSTLSTMGLIALMWFFFRSFKPILLTSLSVIIGIFFGIASVNLFQNSIHLLTIGFGSCLVGASVDYAIHFLTGAYVSKGKTIDEIRGDIFKPICFGAVTTLLSFFFLIFTEFSGLRELSLFALGSLIGSCLTVLVFFPSFADWWMVPNQRVRLLALRLQFHSENIFKSRKTRWFIGLSFFLLLISGLTKLKFNDDIRLLQSPNEALLSEIKWIDGRNRMTIPSAYLVISEGFSSKNRFELSKFLSNQKLSGKLKGYLPNDPFYRTNLEKSESFKAFSLFQKNNRSGILNVLNEIGLSDEILERYKNSVENGGDLVGSRAERKGLISLYGVKSIREFEIELKDWGAMETSFVRLLNQPKEISLLFEESRQIAISQVALAYFIIFALLIMVYGFKNAVKVIVVTMLAGLLSFSVLGILGLAVNFFSVLALVIVLGLGIDYSIFLLRDHGDYDNSSSMFSVFLSMLSTVITFGFFSFSSTPLLQSLAAVISLGVIFSFLLANLMLPINVRSRRE